MKLIAKVAAAAIFTSYAVGATSTSVAQEACDGPILMGTTVSDSGPFSPLGAGWHAMTTAFEEEINAAGGVYVAECGKSLDIKFIIYDDHSNPSNAVTLFERLVSEDNVDVLVGPDWSSLGLAVSAVAERHQIPIVMGNVAAQNVFRPGQRYVFGTPYPIVPLWSERYFDALRTVEPRPETIFFISQDNPVTSSITEFWGDRAVSEGYRVVGQEVFPADLRDFTPIILKVRQASPDIVYISSFDNASVPLVQQMRQLRVSAKGVHHVMLSGALARQVGGDIEGMTGEIAWVPAIENEHSELATKIMEKAGVDPFASIFALGRYSAYLVMIQAIEEAGSLDRNKIRDALHSSEFSGPGGIIKFDENGYPTETNGAYTIQIKDGAPVVVWPQEQAAGDFTWPSPSWQ